MMGARHRPRIFVVGRGFAVAATGLIHSMAHIQGNGQFKCCQLATDAPWRRRTRCGRARRIHAGRAVLAMLHAVHMGTPHMCVVGAQTGHPRRDGQLKLSIALTVSSRLHEPRIPAQRQGHRHFFTVTAVHSVLLRTRDRGRGPWEPREPAK